MLKKYVQCNTYTLTITIVVTIIKKPTGNDNSNNNAISYNTENKYISNPDNKNIMINTGITYLL